MTSAGRRGFERLYDLPARVIPSKVLAEPCPGEAEAQRLLVAMAASALGVASEIDLRDYFRLPVAATKSRIAELVEAGTLRAVTVEDWKNTGYLHREVKQATAVEARALVSPFDSLIWQRQRTERLFGFHYRLAFYTPKHKRTQGYYVMPFLLGDRLVARVDLKSDRKASRLLVLGGHAEAEIDVNEVAPALKAELELMAQWLGLARVAIRSRTALASALRRV